MAETTANIGETLLDHTVGSSSGGEGFDPTTGQSPREGWFLQTLAAGPGMYTSASTTAFRSTNTITGGGWGRGSRINPDAGGAFRQGLRHNIPRPRNTLRYGSQNIFHGAEGAYSPFQAGPALNWIANKTGISNRVEGSGDLFARGGLARFGAASRIERAGVASSHVSGFLSGAGFTDAQVAGFQAAGPRTMGEATALSGGGRITGRMHGFYTGTHGGYTEAFAKHMDDFIGGVDYAKNAGMAVDTKVQQRAAGYGAARAGSAAGKQLADDVAGKLGVEGAELYGRMGARNTGRMLMGQAGVKGLKFVGTRAAGMAAKVFTGPVGWAMMAFDLAHMLTIATGAAVGYGLRTTGAAIQSFKGNISGGIMDQGFIDNSTSISSRSRGVMAIQNSRLNARSVLGNEASAMHAHFG